MGRDRAYGGHVMQMWITDDPEYVLRAHRGRLFTLEKVTLGVQRDVVVAHTRFSTSGYLWNFLVLAEAGKWTPAQPMAKDASLI